MNSFKGRLLSGTVIPLMIGVGVAIGGVGVATTADVPEAVVASHPCSPCNPCAAASPCSPCAAASPCSPCGAASPAAACVIPRLAQAQPCAPCAPAQPCAPCAPAQPCAANPCAANPCAANPCAANPCAVNPCAANPCAANPCAANPCAANPCAANPCAANPCAANPCAANPCAANPCAANPCAANPCAPAESGEPTEAEAAAAYDCIADAMQAAYAKSGHPVAAAYIDWPRYNKVPYRSETHGNRYVNNYANDVAKDYGAFEDAGVMPAGSVVAKNSFGVSAKGQVSLGPLFVMEKMPAGFNPPSADWRYTMIMPDGGIYGTTKGASSAKVQFCVDCHMGLAEDTDSLLFIPDEYRISP